MTATGANVALACILCEGPCSMAEQKNGVCALTEKLDKLPNLLTLQCAQAPLRAPLHPQAVHHSKAS